MGPAAACPSFELLPGPYPLPCAIPSAPPLPPPTQIADLVAAGKVRLEVALTLPLAQAAKAHEQVATGHTRGKVVLTP